MESTTHPDFERAWYKSGGEKDQAVDSLLVAADRLEEAVPNIRRFKDDADLKEAVQKCADYLSQVLVRFPDVRVEYFGTE